VGGNEPPTEAKAVAIPSRTLSGGEESAYLDRLRTVVSAARLGPHHPDGSRLVAHLGVLSPAVHRGLYEGLEVDLRSGLPTYKEWTRAQTDVRLAADQLRQLGPREDLERKAAAKPDSVFARQAVKHDYYSAIRDAGLAPLGEMSVALRRVEPEKRRAAFHVVLDKLDASGLFVRYSIDLAQTADAWDRRVVVLDKETARHTEGFRALIYQFTSYDSEFTLVRLATLGGLEIERVVKGVVGPVCFSWTRTAEELRPVVGTDGLVANFALDMAAVDLPTDRDNDPFADILRERLSPEARREYDEARRRWGYKVFKDRKFVASKDAVPALQALCTARGTKNVVYGI
jgi:hypothetical protein